MLSAVATRTRTRTRAAFAALACFGVVHSARGSSLVSITTASAVVDFEYVSGVGGWACKGGSEDMLVIWPSRAQHGHKYPLVSFAHGEYVGQVYAWGRGQGSWGRPRGHHCFIVRAGGRSVGEREFAHTVLYIILPFAIIHSTTM